jgi:hypothetical protein
VFIVNAVNYVTFFLTKRILSGHPVSKVLFLTQKLLLLKCKIIGYNYERKFAPVKGNRLSAFFVAIESIGL